MWIIFNTWILYDPEFREGKRTGKIDSILE